MTQTREDAVYSSHDPARESEDTFVQEPKRIESDVVPGATGTEAVDASSDDRSNSKDDSDRKPDKHGRVEITEDDCYDELGFSFPSWKKWTILSVIFAVQVSMNFNTSLYSNGIGGISMEFGVSEQAARCGAMIFLVLYAFGCELWAPYVPPRPPLPGLALTRCL